MTSKQSELETIENIETETYDEIVLSEVIEPVLGKTPARKDDENWGGEIKWASAKDISQNSTRRIYDTAENMTERGKRESNAKKMPEGTLVVVARGATMGRSAQLGEPMTFNQTCYGLDASNELDDDFLYYAWKYRFNQIQAVSHGTVFDTITMSSFDDIFIPFPDIETQKKIASVLSNFDNKIEVNNKISDLLEEIAQSLFENKFVDFDPYEETKETDVGEIPEKFVVAEIDDFIWCGRGYSYTSEYLDKEDEIEDSYPMINLKNVEEGGGFRTDGYKYYTESSMKDRYLIGKRDLILAITDLTQEGGLIGSPALVPGLDAEKNIISQDVAKIIPEQISREYLYHLFRTDEFQKYAQSRATGTTVLHLSLESIGEFKFPKPPSEDMRQFSEVARDIHAMKASIIKENSKLEALRDALLPELMSGEVRANDINMGV